MLKSENEARALATRVVKESNAVVKFGRTNGKICLHIKENRQSVTIFDESEWDTHPWNRTNQKRERAPDIDLLAAVANKEAA